MSTAHDSNSAGKSVHPFGAVLRKAREDKDMTQYRLAKNARRQVSQIYQIETGRGEPKASTIIWLAEALGMEPAELFQRLVDALRSSELGISSSSPQESHNNAGT